MARKKSKRVGAAHSKKASKRKRVSGVKFDAISPVLLIAGAIAGNYAKQALKETLTIKGKDYSGAAVLVAGVVMPMVMKEPMLKSFSNGLIVSGGLSTLATFVPQIPINGLDTIGAIDMVGAVNVETDTIGMPNSFIEATEELY